MVTNKTDESNNNGIDAVFLLRTGKSLDIRIDSFIKSLKPLSQGHCSYCMKIYISSETVSL